MGGFWSAENHPLYTPRSQATDILLIVRKSWPELVGVDAEQAKSIIESEPVVRRDGGGGDETSYVVDILSPDHPSDGLETFYPRRVRLFADEHGKVTRVPHNG